jgi:hypothetical protein
MECVLIFVLIGQKSALLALMRSNKGSGGGNSKFQEFLACDSDNPDFRARACKNAFRLISQHRYSLACALFLLADDISSAMDVAVNRLGDFMLAVAIARLHSKEPSAAFSQEYERFLSEALGDMYPAATAGDDCIAFLSFMSAHACAALLYRQGRNEEMLRHLLLVSNFGYGQTDSNSTPVLPLLSVFDLMLFVHELVLMPQVQRWKQLLPPLSEICSDLSNACEQLCVLCCRMLTIASGDCCGPHVAFVLLKAFHIPAASEPHISFMHPSLRAFFLTSLCGWLELDPLDISYSMSSMPTILADTVLRLTRKEMEHDSSIAAAYQSAPASSSLRAARQSRLNFHLLPSNICTSQRWQMLLSAASANVSASFRFACSVQACVVALCFPSVSQANIAQKCTEYARDAVQFMLANHPLSDEAHTQQMLHLCSSWLDIAYDASPRRDAEFASKKEHSPVTPLHRGEQSLLQLPRLNIVYEKEAALLNPVQGNSRSLNRPPPPLSVHMHSVFWAQCIGESVLQLLQALVPEDGDVAASMQPCRLLLLQEIRSSGISLNIMNAFAFERFASPPDWLQEVVAVMNNSDAIAVLSSARNALVLIQKDNVKPPNNNKNNVFIGNATAISNVLSCRRRVISSGSDIVPVFGPSEEVACTREMIRSIALIPALSEPCIVAAGTDILAEIKLLSKGSLVGRALAPAPKSIESVVSSGLKKLGNSLFAKVRMSCVAHLLR